MLIDKNQDVSSVVSAETDRRVDGQTFEFLLIQTVLYWQMSNFSLVSTPFHCTKICRGAFWRVFHFYEIFVVQVYRIFSLWFVEEVK